MAWQNPKARSAYSDLLGQAQDATPAQRAISVGHVPGYSVSNHREELEHFTGWNYVAVHTIAKQWGRASINVYDKSEEVEKAGRATRYVVKSHAADSPAEERKPIPNHPIAKLLKSPNPLQGQQEFLYLVATQMHLTGSCVIWEIRNLQGHPAELWVIPKAWLQYQPPDQTCILGSWRVYNPRGLTGWAAGSPLVSGFRVDIRDTIICNWPHPLYPGEGRSPLAACASIIDITEKSDEAITSSLIEAPRPGMVILLGDNTMMTTEQVSQMKESIKDGYAGSHNAGKVLAVQGVKIDKMGTGLTDLEATEMREQNRKFSLGIQGVPSIATGAADEMTAAGAAAVLNNFTEQTVQPGLDLVFGKFTSRWQRIFGDDFTAEADAKRYDDPAIEMQRSEAIKDAASKGFATGNEWRATVKLEPLPELEQLQQPPQPGMVGPDGMPVAGGMPPGAPADPNAAGDEGFDLNADLGDDGADTFDLEPALVDDAPPNRLAKHLNGALNGHVGGSP